MKVKILAGIISFFLIGLISYIIFKRTLRSYEIKYNTAMMWTGDYDKAIENCNKLIWWNKTESDYFFLRGNAFAAKGENQQALNDYKKAIKLGYPDTLNILLRIALAAKEKGDYQLAEQTFIEIAQKSKKYQFDELDYTYYWAANYHLGQLAFNNKKYIQAIYFYDQAKLTEPSKLEQYHRANAYFALGQIDSAIYNYNNSIGFVKQDFVRHYPNSYLAECDTCGFPFGTKEYELLTSVNNKPLMKDLLEKLKYMKVTKINN